MIDSVRKDVDPYSLIHLCVVSLISRDTMSQYFVHFADACVCVCVCVLMVEQPAAAVERRLTIRFQAGFHSR